MCKVSTRKGIIEKGVDLRERKGLGKSLIPRKKKPVRD